MRSLLGLSFLMMALIGCLGIADAPGMPPEVVTPPSPLVPLPTSTRASLAITIPMNPSAVCLVTLHNGNGEDGPYENDALTTYLWHEGRVVFRPNGPGTINADGSLGMKWGWNRKVHGKLTIEGRRLDAPASPLRAHISDGYGDFGFQATGITFPTEGCWEVTGKVGNGSLTFVTLVVKESTWLNSLLATPTPSR